MYNPNIQDNLNLRLNYMGGSQEGRMQKGKLYGLKKALLYSYQAETAILKDGRLFRCLLNPDKMKADYDIKEVSIPFKDICIGRDGEIEGFIPSDEQITSLKEEEIGMKVGDVFQIDKDKTHWLVVQQNLEEDAYFRGTVYRADQQVEVGGIKYWTYLRGPNETTIQWNQKSKDVWNDLNYSMIMYITKDENTLKNLHRFTKLHIPNAGIEGTQNEDEMNTWQVAAINPYYYDGVIQVMLDEYYNNPIEDMREAAKEEEKKEFNTSIISGQAVIYPFDSYTYKVNGEFYSGGEWKVINKGKGILRIIKSADTEIQLFVESGKHFDFELQYLVNGQTYSKKIEVDSL